MCCVCETLRYLKKKKKNKERTILRLEKDMGGFI